MTRLNTALVILASLGSFSVGTSDANAGNLSDIAKTCSWTFGRLGGVVYATNLKLEADGTVGGYVHQNEVTWRIEDGDLVVLGSNGRVTTRYTTVGIQKNSIVLTGPFLLNTKVTHFMKCHS